MGIPIGRPMGIHMGRLRDLCVDIWLDLGVDWGAMGRHMSRPWGLVGRPMGGLRCPCLHRVSPGLPIDLPRGPLGLSIGLPRGQGRCATTT